MLNIKKQKKISDSALEQVSNETVKQKTPINKKKILDIVFAVFVLLAHVAIGLVIYFSFRYYAIYPSLFGSIVGVVVCILAIIDIIFFVGFNHKDLALKIISLVLALFLTIGGTVGTVVLNNVNSTVDNVLYDGSDRYETVSGVLVHNAKSDDIYNDIADVNGKTVGIVSEKEVGVATIGQKQLDALNTDYGLVEYNTSLELIMALVNENIDVAILPNGYRSILEKDENANYSSILETLVDFYTFEEEVKVDTEVSSKDISIEPFTVLLIGWSRTDIGSTVGLADAIIIATVNPKTYTVSMTSIARDSYVPIPCYGGTKDKINSGRSTSRACFIETVEELVGEKMDFYIEADYQAIVNIVNALGGVKISNPVDFTLDGIYVPAGNYLADGQQALQFCRERHHMPNGDFDRQQHQKEVIMEVVKTLLNKGDLSVALNVLDAAGKYMTTNLTLKQLTNMFNMILNTKNFTGLKTFNLLDFQQSRVTGYASWYYNYGMQLPLWIYKIYNGSLQESIDHMETVLGNNVDTSDQEYSMEFSCLNPYERPLFYSLSYDEKEEHEEMPPYYPDLTGMTEEEVKAWADANGVTLEIKYITSKDAGYIAEKEGKVVAQSVYYGRLVSENKKCTVTIMGEGGEIPSFEGMTVEEAEEWAEMNGYNFKAEAGDPADDEEYVGIIYKQEYNKEKNRIKVYYYDEPAGEIVVVKVEVEKSSMGTVSGGGEYPVRKEITVYAQANKGYVFDGWYNGYKLESEDAEYTFKVTGKITLTARFKEEGKCDHNYQFSKYKSEPTCTKSGVAIYKCTKCGEEEERTVDALGHDYQFVKNNSEATCEKDGEALYRCSRCGDQKTEKIPALGHDYGDNEPTCRRCGASNPYYVPPTPDNPEEPGDDEEDQN